MGWTKAIDLSELKKNNRQTADINGNKILFIWHDEKVHAVAAQCPHFKLPLLKATINDKNELVCPFHKSAFDLDAGTVQCWAPWPAALSGVLRKLSKPKPLKIYPTRIENNQILVDVA